MGRSNGCFAMGTEQFREALLHLSGGRLIYADSLGLDEDGNILPVPDLARYDRKPLDFGPGPAASAF
jgi:hypothetical protein